jgi:hypothetical protein
MLLTLLAGNLNQARGSRVLETIVPVLVSEDTIYQGLRADYSLLLFWRTVTPETEVGQGLYQTSFRWTEPELEYQRFDHQQFFRFVQPPAAPGITPWNLLFQPSYRPTDVEPDYLRTSTQTLFQFISAPAPIIVVPPPPVGGGLLPGVPPWPNEMGKGMGPYKRPGQVFGEQDPPSPFLTALAPDLVPDLVARPAAYIEPVIRFPDEELALILLLAMEETSRKD